MNLSVHTTTVDSDIVNENWVTTDLEIGNENCVVADSEIGNNSGVVSSFTFFFVGWLHSLI
jgi:hypothetical protein